MKILYTKLCFVLFCFFYLQLQIIWEWIPIRLSLMKPTLLFSSEEHGTAIRTLYTRTEHASQTILVIKTTANEVSSAVLMNILLNLSCSSTEL